MIKHATSSVFVFCELSQGWRLGLIEHPRLGRHMVVGGHVERDETQAEAAVRETVEESGLCVRLLACPSPVLPVGYPHERVAAPWWITEMMVPADNHLAEPHVHVDHQYVAVADSPVPVSEPVHPFAWFSAGELDGLAMFEDTRLLAGVLFPWIGSVAAAADGDEATMLRVLGPPGSARSLRRGAVLGRFRQFEPTPSGHRAAIPGSVRRRVWLDRRARSTLLPEPTSFASGTPGGPVLHGPSTSARYPRRNGLSRAAAAAGRARPGGARSTRWPTSVDRGGRSPRR